jgi:hypothetical protein
MPGSDAKLTVGRFYFRKLLPRAWSLAEQLQAGDDSIMALDAESF